MQASETRYSLRIETGERQGETMPLHEGLATLGRRSDNTFVLPSGSVSGRHAEIRVDQDRVELSDLGSTNGTKVAGRKVDNADLAHGDEITLGSFKLRLLDSERGEVAFVAVEDDDEIQLEDPSDPLAETEFQDPPPRTASAPPAATATQAPPPKASPKAAKAPKAARDDGALSGSGGLERVSAEKVAASGSRSRLGLLGLGLLVAVAVSVFTWTWKQRQASADGSGGPTVLEEEGNLLAGGTFEQDADELDWSSPDTAQGFQRGRQFARTGRAGLGVELADGDWALSHSPSMQLSSAASSKGLRLKGSVRSTGNAEGRLGVEFTSSSDGDPAGAVYVWLAAIGSSDVGFTECEGVVHAPAGYRHARFVVAARGVGEVALDDVGLFEGARDAALDANYNEIGFQVLGQGASTAALERAGRAVLPSLQLGRWDARGLSGTGSAGWAVEEDGRGFKTRFEGSPSSLSVLVSDNGIDLGSDDQAWIATSGEGGYRGHALQFERSQARSIFLGRGTELLRLGFSEDVTVRGEPHPVGLALNITLGDARAMELQLSFVEERTEATVLVSQADEAERKGRAGDALVAWSRLLDEYPIERGQVKRAEEARARLVGAGLDSVAEVRAAFERARFFALPELYRQGRKRCRELSVRYRGSEVEAEALALDAEIAGELDKASTGGLAQESELLENVLKSLDPKAQPQLIDHLRRAIERRGSEDNPGDSSTGGAKEEDTDG